MYTCPTHCIHMAKNNTLFITTCIGFKFLCTHIIFLLPEEADDKTRMQVGVPSLLESVVIFCDMCNRPSAKVLCDSVYESIVRSRMAKVHSLNAYHTCIKVCEPDEGMFLYSVSAVWTNRD